MISNFAIFFVFQIFIFTFFFKNITDCCICIWFLVLFLLIFFFFLRSIIFIWWSLKDSQNFFMQSLPQYTSCFFSMLLNYDIVDIEKPDGICFLTFVADEFLALFLHQSIFSIIHSRSAWIRNDALSDFWYWLNSNNLVSWEGIITWQKSLFSHTLLWDSIEFFVLKKWWQFRL